MSKAKRFTTTAPITVGFDTNQVRGMVEIYGIDPKVLAMLVLTPVVKALPSGRVKIIGYGLIPFSRVPTNKAMKEALRNVGADL